VADGFERRLSARGTRLAPNSGAPVTQPIGHQAVITRNCLYHRHGIATVAMKKQNRSGPGRPPTITDPFRTICDAASALFAEKGYETASLQDVADAVGVTKAGLYHYFSTKQALFDAIVLNTLEELHETASAAIAAQPDHRSRLIGFMSRSRDIFLGTWRQVSRQFLWSQRRRSGELHR
jgi:AcrR family transcriptional regulator